MTTLLSRRLFLQKAASTLPAVIVTAAPVVTAIAAETIDPIAAMGPAVEKAAAGFQRAQANLQAAAAHFEAASPVPPDDLVTSSTGWLCSFAEGERDAYYKPRIRPGRATSLLVAHSQPMRYRRDTLDKRIWEARELKRLIPIAEAYEGEVEALREISGLNAAEVEFSNAEWQAETVIVALSETAATSLAGLGVKARAIQMFADMGADISFRARNRIGPVLAQDVAAFVATGREG
jgi:hypothetical protein